MEDKYMYSEALCKLTVSMVHAGTCMLQWVLVIQYFEHGNALKLHVSDEMCFDFYLSHVWQSRVEIEHYSVAYFDRIAAFEAL